MNRIIQTILHGIRTRWLIMTVFAIGTIWAIFWLEAFSPGFKKTKWEHVDTVLKIGTFFAAWVVAWTQLCREWEDHLPKRLSVLCSYNGHIVLLCREAYLAGEDDIRTWGQQISRQMNNGQLLALNDPFIKQRELSVMWDPVRRVHYKPYVILMQLDEMPKAVKELDGLNPCIYWGKEHKGHIAKACIHGILETDVWPANRKNCVRLPDFPPTAVTPR